MEALVNSSMSFWRGRRVFMTGHTGFKGAWLSILLSRLGAEVHGYALDAVEGSIYESAEVEKLMVSSTTGDVRDMDALRTAMHVSQPDIVVHLAAQSLVRLSYALPVETYAVNVLGTVHVLEVLRGLQSAKAAIVVTSDKCYENREWAWGYRENEMMGGYDPYSSSKGCAELVTSAYRRSFFSRHGVKIASCRAGNVIGGGDVSLDRLIPDLVRTFRAGRKASIRAPDAVRPWQHVLEPLSGYLALAEALFREDGARYADGWNFGPDHSSERTVSDVADAVAKVWGGGASWQHEVSDHLHEAHYLKLDTSKSRASLKWRPKWSFDRAIAETVSWYLAADRGENMLAFTQAQLEYYLGFRDISSEVHNA